MRSPGLYWSTMLHTCMRVPIAHVSFADKPFSDSAPVPYSFWYDQTQYYGRYTTSGSSPISSAAATAESSSKPPCASLCLHVDCVGSLLMCTWSHFPQKSILVYSVFPANYRSDFRSYTRRRGQTRLSSRTHSRCSRSSFSLRGIMLSLEIPFFTSGVTTVSFIKSSSRVEARHRRGFHC